MSIRFAELLDFAARTERDLAAAPDALHERDRRLADQHQLATVPPVDAARRWLAASPTHESSRALEALSVAERILAVGLIVSGLIIGAATARAILWYEGSQPINVVVFLGVFVFAQLALIALTMMLAMPGAGARWLPGLSSVQTMLTLLSPGRWRGGLTRWLPGPMREAWREASAGIRRYRRRYASVERWRILMWSQCFAIAFNVSAIVTTLLLVTFTDLAFGWATTLAIEADTIRMWVGWLATPWAGWLPQAVPDAALIESTRFFRGDAFNIDGVGERGAWWRFAVMALAVYGLLPRVLLGVLCRWRLNVAIEKGFHATPGFAALIKRFSAPLVETRSPSAASDADGSRDGPYRRTDEVGSSAVAPIGSGQAATVLVWAHADEHLADVRGAIGAALGLDAVALRDIGGQHSIEDDLETIRAVANTGDADGAQPIVVLTKSWEPPLLEFFDLVESIRAEVGPARAIYVVPLVLGRDTDGPGVQEWRRKARQFGDDFALVKPLAVAHEDASS
ncbi:MAG: DUF2868 domain-containing protein [Pseudomonadota bacterium]